MRAFNIGGPIALGVVGAILYLALPNVVPGVDTKMIGIILFIAAVIWLILGLVLTRPRTHVVTERTAEEARPAGYVADTTARREAVRGDRVVEREVRQDEV